MKILITGGAGFIGSHLADKLVVRGDKVTVIDNLATGRLANVNKAVSFVNASITQYDVISKLFLENSFDVVVHAAASYKDPDDWQEDVLTNCLGGINIIKLCKKHPVKRLIYFQTSCAYGKDIKEAVTPDHLFKPDSSSYAITKATAEYFIKISGVPYISFRLANCTGARSLTGPIPSFYQRLSTGQPCFVTDTRRDFINQKDLCSVVIRAIDGEGANGAYNISTGKDYSIEQLYFLVAKELGITDVPEIRPKELDDTYTLLIDPTNTERDFPGWKAATPIECTVKEAVEWYSCNEVGSVYTHLRMKK